MVEGVGCFCSPRPPERIQCQRFVQASGVVLEALALQLYTVTQCALLSLEKKKPVCDIYCDMFRQHTQKHQLHFKLSQNLFYRTTKREDRKMHKNHQL